MVGASICVNTQTPLVQFLPTTGRGRPLGGRTTVRLKELRDGVDCRFTPGGVTRMVYPLVRRLLETKTLREAHWVALQPAGPRTILAGGLTLHHVTLPGARMVGYGAVKEAIWGRIHELDMAEPHDDLFWSEAFSEYAYYNRITAERIRTLDDAHDFDAFYVHDFQQMAVGHMLGTLKPKIFRWHIPFDAAVIPDKWRSLLLTYLDSYDVLVVSTERYAASLRSLRPRGRIVQMYPYIDPDDYGHPGAARVAATCKRLGLSARDLVVLVVGRMDPMKGQDRAIEAVARLTGRYPTLRLVLVGNGSFSGSSGGLGLSKSATWRERLEELVRRRRLDGRVLFTGHLPQPDLDCLYERARCTLLPSVQEGFGLVVVESWIHDTPVLVTERAGIAELIQNGVNGLLFDPDDPAALAHQMELILNDDSGALGARLARNARATSKLCSLEAAERTEGRLLAELTGP
jgi:glycosyltransferase involved in cell wall biosynthesis